MRPQFVVNHQPTAIDRVNQETLKSNLLVGSNDQCQGISNSTLIGQDLWNSYKAYVFPYLWVCRSSSYKCRIQIVTVEGMASW